MALQVQTSWNQAHAPLLNHCFPKTPRTQSEEYPGSVDLITTKQNKLPSFIIHRLHSFLHVNKLTAPFSSHHKLCNYAEPKPLSCAKPACFEFSSSNFNVQNHTLSTAGDALTSVHLQLPGLVWFGLVRFGSFKVC